jgi:DNA-binding CsgD family transcriptional regulator
MLAYSSALAPLGALAAQHHERVDGSGYPRGLSGSALGMPARVLAAADVYRALVEPRPHRPPRSSEEAESELRAQVAAGELDGEAVEAVLGAADNSVTRRREWAAGLTPREVEVLRAVARGRSNEQVADLLSISTKAVRNHVEQIYSKIGVSSRAAASLFAMRHGLLSDLETPANEAKAPLTAETARG